ncbi:FUSC family protein [Microvirga terricola]|uniref:FUSC family protein n=1 Tax=Microvirga terricola TaxID=2719797 RepID=A0ABX0V938_9HYPH|nr:FUSC family protein [Microvirga terricola]NIX76334.1 FUSC family protein [Microvirga terricola]
MPQPSWREVVFAMKTFGAAMLALYLAFILDLTQPSWAMLTVFVVSQPITGMVVAKSLFRVTGTVVGAVVALVLVGAFAQVGPFFLTSLALWIGLCTFVAVLLRDAPAAYGAMLSGYTAAIIGIPAALAPDTAFDYAVGRCLEIIIGIGCATLVSQLVFPRRAGEALRISVDATLTAAARWVGDVLRGESEEEKTLADQRKMIADVIALDALRVYAAFDTPSVRAAGDVTRHLQGQVLMLLSLLVAINDRAALLRSHAPTKQGALRPFFDEVAALLDRDEPLARDPELSSWITDLQSRLAHALPGFDDLVRDHQNILVRNILTRLRDALGTWQRVLVLRDSLYAGRPLQMPEAAPSSARYRDLTLALVAGAISTVTVLLASAFWVATGWPHGSSAVIFSGIMCSILASLDDPATAAENFLRMTFLSAVVAAIYLFAVFPLIDDFPSLVIVLLPFYLPFGVLLALPRIGTLVTPLGLNLAALLSLSNTSMQTDMAAYINSASALLIGIVASILSFRLLRPLGTEWTVRRIRRGILRDLERIAAAISPVDRNRFASRMFDRINALFSRLDTRHPDQRAIMRSALSALRVGFNILNLKQARTSLSAPLARSLDQVFAALAAHFGALKDGVSHITALPEIDWAAALLLEEGGAAGADVLTALVALGSALHRHQDFFDVARPHLVPEVLRNEAPTGSRKSTSLESSCRLFWPTQLWPACCGTRCRRF